MKTIKEIKNKIEYQLEETEFIHTLVNQVQDNLDEINTSARKCRQDENLTNLYFLLHEVDYYKATNEKLLNLVIKLNEQLESKLTGVHADLSDLEAQEWEDEKEHDLLQI